MAKSTVNYCFNTIKAKILIDVALAHYGATLTKRGKRLIGVCPVHRGTNPTAFVVSEDRRAWHCFGDCSRGGTVLDLVMALEDCSLVDAAKLLSKRHGL